MRVIGAGLPRTGTLSLKPALERLLGGPCYHGNELARHLDHVPRWREAIAGRPPEWHALLSEFVATADWPAAACWRELSEAHPIACWCGGRETGGRPCAVRWDWPFRPTPSRRLTTDPTGGGCCPSSASRSRSHAGWCRPYLGHSQPNVAPVTSAQSSPSME